MRGKMELAGTGAGSAPGNNARRGRAKWHVLPVVFTVVVGLGIGGFFSAVWLGLYLVDPVAPNGDDNFQATVLGMGSFLIIFGLGLPIVALVAAVIWDLITIRMHLAIRFVLPVSAYIALTIGAVLVEGLFFVPGVLCCVALSGYWLVFQLNQIAFPALGRYIAKRKLARSQTASQPHMQAKSNATPPFRIGGEL